MTSAASGPGTAGPLQRVLFVSGSGADSSTLRYRVRLPEEALRSRGVRTAAVHFTDPRVGDFADRADVVVLYRCPAAAEIVRLLGVLRRRVDPPLVTYDIDDLVFRSEHLESLHFLPGFARNLQETFARDVALRAELVPYADLVTGSTQQVLDELSQLTDAPAALLPNGVGIVGARLAEDARGLSRRHQGLRIGYFSGSATHDEDWRAVEAPVLDFLAERPDAELWLVGKVRPTDEVKKWGDRVRRLPAVDWQRLPQLLRSIDVAMAPLAPNPFNEAKSAIKWLEAALVDTPAVASPTPPFVDAIDDGETGLLASSPQEWLQAFRILAEDPERRAALGAAARQESLRRFGPQAQADRLLDVFGGAALPVATPEPAGEPTVAELPHVWLRVPHLLADYPWPDGLEALVVRPGPKSQMLGVGYRTVRMTAPARRGAIRAGKRVGRRSYLWSRRWAARILGNTPASVAARAAEAASEPDDPTTSTTETTSTTPTT